MGDYVGNSSAIGDAPYWSAAGFGGFSRDGGCRETRDYLYNKETRDMQSRDTRFLSAQVERANDNVNKGVCDIKDTVQITAAANALLVAQENEKTRSLINDRDVQRLYAENAALQGKVTKADCGTPAGSCGTVLGQCGSSSGGDTNVQIISVLSELKGVIAGLGK